MSDSAKRLLEVYEVVEQIVLVLLVLLYYDLTIEDLFYRGNAWSKTCLFFYKQFLSLGLESVEHDPEGMADGTIGLTPLEVAFLW